MRSHDQYLAIRRAPRTKTTGCTGNAGRSGGIDAEKHSKPEPRGSITCAIRTIARSDPELYGSSKKVCASTARLDVQFPPVAADAAQKRARGCN